jgi:Pyruvate/2-oxoacid:ferredoxin oxidoreductase gamma subunit
LLRLYGGFGDKADLPALNVPALKHLILRDMPSVGLKAVFDNLPELQTFHVENVEDFTKENFIKIFNSFEKYVGLEKIVLDLLQFDIEEQKEVVKIVLRTHAKTLRHLSFARNKVSNAFIEDVCQVLAGEENILEHIDFKYLKETKDINWVAILKSVAMIGARSKRDVTVTLTSY